MTIEKQIKQMMELLELNQWHNEEETMKRFNVGKTKLYDWTVLNPKIMRYTGGKRRDNKMYNWKVILEELYNQVAA